MKPAEIVRRPIDALRPDPNQPRKTFDEERIKALAGTYRTEGQIVPLEADESNLIVTGERRWRAAKLAGLREVDVIVRSPENRLRRQLIEEFHRESIPTLERARATKRFVEEFQGRGESAIAEAARSLGVDAKGIRQLLSMIEEPEIEKAIEEGKVEPWKAVELKQALGEERAKKFIKTRTTEELDKTTQADIRPLRRAPEKVKEAVATGKVEIEDVRPVVDVIPEEAEEQEKLIEELTEVKKVRAIEREELREVLEKEKERPPEVVDKSQRAMDERRVKHFRSVWDTVSLWMPAMVSGVKDEDLQQEAISYIQRISSHTKNLLEGLGHFEIPEDVLDVSGERD